MSEITSVFLTISLMFRDTDTYFEKVTSVITALYLCWILSTFFLYPKGLQTLNWFVTLDKKKNGWIITTFNSLNDILLFNSYQLIGNSVVDVSTSFPCDNG